MLNEEPMKNIYMNTQENHNCSDLFIFPAVASILQLRVRLDGWVTSLYETASVLPTKTNLNVTISIIINTSTHVAFTSKHLHSGLVRAGSQTALLYILLLCWI